MKKILFTLVCLACSIMNVMAQASQIATLSHEGTIKTYYGFDALKEAYNAAVNGDVITLSSGQFNAVDISKGITIRGAGWNYKEDRQPTVISGDMLLSSSGGSSNNQLILEGVYHNDYIRYSTDLGKAQFNKCRLRFVVGNNSSENCSLSFFQCKIVDHLTLDSNCNATCLNSYISFPRSYPEKSTTSIFYFKNCIIETPRMDYITSSSLKNTILLSTYGSNMYDAWLDGSNTAYYCIVTGGNFFPDGAFLNISDSSNKVVTEVIFKNDDNRNNIDDRDFVLTDEAAAMYLGDDGTQVGIYGGEMPYATTPNNPQITKFNVSPKASADGKLKVDIEISPSK